MTANNAPSPIVISDSTSLSTAYYACNRGEGDAGWYASGTTGYWQVYLGTTGRIVISYTLVYNVQYGTYPTDWTFLGSNDGTNWTTLDTITGQVFGGNEMKTYSISNSTSYTYYKINVTGSGNASWVGFGEIELIESSPAEFTETTTNAYKTVVAKSLATRTLVLGEIFTQMEAMGWTPIDGKFTPITFSYTAVSIAADTFTYNSHGLVDWMPIQITSTGTAPGGTAKLALYYITQATTNTFKLTATVGGSPINISSQGTGNHTIANAYRIYKSNGVNADKIYERVKISYWESITVIKFSVWYKYDFVFKTDEAGYATTFDLTVSNTANYLWIHGNKDLVHITLKISTTYYRLMFGHMKTFTPLSTNLTQAVSAGSGVTLNVASTAGFEVGYSYSLLGATMEGIERVTVASIINSTSLTVTTLVNSFSSGSRFAILPSTFGIWSNGYYYFNPTIPIGGSSSTPLANNASYSSHGYMIPQGSIDPDYASNKYMLQPLLFHSASDMSQANFYAGYYMDEYFLVPPYTGLVIEDTFAINRLDSGTSSGSNSASILNDTSKSWTTNAFAGKVVIITSSTGIGQIKKIASNTATALTLETGWTFTTVPINTSNYTICDEAYRFIADAVNLSLPIALREGI
jgi:hypothetical protein